jgi:hypothetical protein
MLEPTAAPCSFEPETLARMGRAFEAALVIAEDEGSPFTSIPVLVVRASLARFIIEDAQRGVRDADILKARALQRLARTHSSLG